jgi:DNA-binding MarR family transcriptional regulator
MTSGKPRAAHNPAMDTATRSAAVAAHFVDDYLPALLAQASQLISAEFHRIVSANGFTVSEWRVLATLAGSEPISIGRLAATTTIKQPTVTRLLDRMAAKGQVERLENDGDRRITLVGITPAGSRMVSKLIPLARAHEQRVLEPFGLQRAEDLKSTLRSIIELHRGSVAEED